MKNAAGRCFSTAGPTAMAIEATASAPREIDVEVRRIIDDSTLDVRSLLLKNRIALEEIALRLIEKEVMDGSELRLLLGKYVEMPPVHPGVPSITIAPGEANGTV